jgi:zinc metalloprotease ZmpA
MNRPHPWRAAPRLAATALAAAALVASVAAHAQSNNRDQAAERALAAVKAFPQRTLDGPGDSYEVRDVMFDADGAEHVRLARRFHGLRVIGGDLVVHSGRGGAFLSATHTLARPARVELTPGLDSQRAAAAAGARFASHAAGAEPELVVYARADSARLAWDVTLHGSQADGTPSRLHAIVDAHSGAVFESWDDIQTAPAVGTGQSLFLGTVALTTESRRASFKLQDNTRGGSKTLDMKNRTGARGTLFSDADNAWGDGSTSNRQTAAVDAAFGGALTWDYFLDVHGRNGIANDGVGANSRVHYGNNYANAFWDDSCFCMTYGDGNASIYPLVSIDVAGHEMSHGVTSRTAGLIYSGESGGLNEGTSDIFGTMVEYYANNGNDVPDYLIGEEIFKGGGSIRNMVNPSTDGASADCWYSTVGGLDVHYSSGIANHFFFLLAEGTTAGSPSKTCAPGNTRVATGNGTLVGIGRAKAEKIWYRALTVYMTSSTNYAAARSATLSAAADLHGAGSPEVNAVAAAWSAVNRP